MNLMGTISRNAKLPNGGPLRVFTGPCILVARNGYAGTMKYIPSGEFTINDHAYVFTPKQEWRDKINPRWFVYEYQELFYQLVTSKSDNATFSSEYVASKNIEIPAKELQDRVANVLLVIDELYIELNNHTHTKMAL